jgi:hypothetical protein
LLWDILKIREDGVLEQVVSTCTTTNFTRAYTWKEVAGGGIEVIPEEYLSLSEGTFMWGADEVATVKLFAGEGCDDIVLSVQYSVENGQSDLNLRYVSGDLCAMGEQCDFSFVWCTGESPEPC